MFDCVVAHLPAGAPTTWHPVGWSECLAPQCSRPSASSRSHSQWLGLDYYYYCYYDYYYYYFYYSYYY